MMKKLTAFFAYTVLMLFATTLFSCSDFLSEDSEKNKVAQATENGAYITLGLESTSARTILPTVTTDDFVYLELKGTIEDGEETMLGTWESVAQMQEAVIALDEGKWNFTLTAYTPSSSSYSRGTQYRATAEKEIALGKNELSFELAYYKYAFNNGNFSITLSYADSESRDAVSYAVARLEQTYDSVVSGYEAVRLEPNDYSVTFAGSYYDKTVRVKVTFYSADDIPLAYYREYMRLVSGITTTATRKIDIGDTYEITYMTNGGDFAEGVSVPEAFSTKTSVTLSEELERAHYTFGGWYTDAECTAGNEITTTKGIGHDLTVYAKWIPDTYTVTFNTNGGSEITSQTVAYPATATEPGTPAKGENGFLGWYASSDGGKTFADTEFDFSSAIESDITLYALYAYTVRHLQQSFTNDEYTEYEVEKMAGVPGTKTNATAKTYEGLTAQSITQQTIASDGSTVVEIYYDVSICTVSFNRNDGMYGYEGYGSVKVRYGETITAPADPEHQINGNYRFDGWYVNGTLFDFSTPITSSFTLYAKWVLMYTVSFEANVISINNVLSVKDLDWFEKQIVRSGDKAVRPDNFELYDSGGYGEYFIENWYTTDSYTKVFDFDTPITTSVSLYAKWVTPLNYIITQISEMTESGTVKGIPGSTLTASNIKNIASALKELYEKRPDVLVKLDFSEVIGLTELPSAEYSWQNTTENSKAFGGSANTTGTLKSYGCTNLVEIILPDGLTKIGSYAFYGCTALTKISLSNSVSIIGENAFGACTSLASAVIPDGITSLPNVFEGCTALTNVTLPDSITSIQGTFKGCTALTNITLPEGITTIADSAFYGCTSLSTVSIPSSVTSIETSAFYGCTRLTSITLPDSIINIGASAFANCTNLTDITIPNSVTTLGTSVFSRCEGLTSVTIPSSITTISDSAFSYCTNLMDVTIPSSVKEIGGSAFSSCTRLSSVTIPSNVKTIGNFAFSGCKGLTNITISSGVLTIGVYAFSDCTGLTSIALPASITSIGSSAFSDCAGLKSISIPGSVTAIANSVFSGCTNLASISIPSGVTTIGEKAFYQCTSLSEIAIPSGVTTIENAAFMECISLISVIIPSKVTKISEATFYGCTGLADITIGSGVTSIGNNAFNGCVGLTSVIIPKTVTSIGMYAFKDCVNLTTVEFKYSGTGYWWKAEGTINGQRQAKEISVSDSSSNPYFLTQELVATTWTKE